MVLSALQTPWRNNHSIRISLHTLTWLYTGGIGQHGEHIYPSGLLGSIRAFSSALPNAVGDSTFTETVWGSTQAGAAHAKQVALRWDTDGLTKESLPRQVSVPKEIGGNSTWYFNSAQQGELTLVLTRRGISDAHWNLLLLALRMQILRASFGAKDQFGLGVLAADGLPDARPLSSVQPLDALPGLQRSFFARIVFARSKLNDEQRLQEGLTWRAYLRGCFRAPNENAADKTLRHYLFGNMKVADLYGSAVNVSAAYPVDSDLYAIRIWGLVPHAIDCPVAGIVENVKPRLEAALHSAPDGFGEPRDRELLFSPSGPALCAWLNQLAGVKDA